MYRSMPLLILIIITMATSGCMSYRAVPGPPYYQNDLSEDWVRLTLEDGKRIEVYHPRIVGPFLIGQEIRTPGTTSRDSLRISLESISRIEVRELDRKEMGLWAAGALVAFYIIRYFSISSAGT